VLLYHGSIDERADLRKQHMSKQNASFPFIVTSYEVAMNDRKYLQVRLLFPFFFFPKKRIHRLIFRPKLMTPFFLTISWNFQNFMWKYMIVDEGHRIKNMNCRLIRELKALPAANRLLLTGTPLQNNLSELWSLLNFLLPDIFDDLEMFQSWFDFDAKLDLQDTQQRVLSEESRNNVVSKLHSILQPFLLRRLKTDGAFFFVFFFETLNWSLMPFLSFAVEKYLPKKKEYLLYAPMSEMQHEFYKATLSRDIFNFLKKKMLGDGEFFFFPFLYCVPFIQHSFHSRFVDKKKKKTRRARTWQ
jgi:ATP-dependent DNA helicase